MYASRTQVLRIQLCLQNKCPFYVYSMNNFRALQLAAKLEALRDEYMRYAVEKCSAVLREYHSAVETITGD